MRSGADRVGVLVDAASGFAGDPARGDLPGFPCFADESAHVVRAVDLTDRQGDAVGVRAAGGSLEDHGLKACRCVPVRLCGLSEFGLHLRLHILRVSRPGIHIIQRARAVSTHHDTVYFVLTVSAYLMRRTPRKATLVPVTRPLVIAAPTLAAWLALRIIAAEYGEPSERGADEAAGVVEGQLSNGREGGRGWPLTS